jgi:hypothetical protein
MNVVGKISLGLTAAALLGPVARAQDLATADQPAATSDQPYATIVARNIFALLPIPPPPPPNTAPTDPPPKITANGITSILGQLQALFKVAIPGRGNQPAREQSYMLSEGERQDEIEVTKIDEATATITFDNHGTIQEIPLVAAKDSGPGPGMGGPARNPFAPGGPNGFPMGRRPGGFAGVGAPGNIPAPMPRNTPAGNPNSGGNGNAPLSAADIAAQGSAGLTPEEQAILTEAERARLMSMEDDAAAGNAPAPSVKDGYYPPIMLPPTRYSPPEVRDAVGGGPPNPSSLTP